MKQTLLIRLIVLCLLVAAPLSLATAQQVFINEIHYDNASTDTGEAVEIAGPAGTDLNGWSIVAYNGNGGAPYNTVALSGVIGDQQNGYGTISVDITGLQNGAPDGLALADSNDSLVQFLSYEGSFVAVGGPANGITSTDIGVAEDFNTPAGNSLQLTGTGTQYGDFTWAADTLASFGQVNGDQQFGSVAPVVFINEIHYDNASTDVDEGVELAGSAGTDLSGWSLVAYNGNGGAPYNTVALSGTFTDQADGFGFIFFPIAGLQNGAPDGIALVDDGGTTVQFLSYEGSFMAIGGPADSLMSEDIGIAEDFNTLAESSLQLTGTGTSYAEFTWTAASSTYNALNAGQSFGDGNGGGDNNGGGDSTSVELNVWINELHYDNSSVDVNEGVEIAGPAGTDLSNYVIVLYNGNGGMSYNTVPLSGILADQQEGFGTAFFAINGLQNGSPDGVALATADDQLIQFLSYEGTMTGVGGPADGVTSEEIPTTESSSTPAGRSLQLIGTGSSYADFVWAAPLPSTYNAVNTGQTFVSPEPTIFINEIHYDNASSDVNEGVEIAGTAGLDLSEYKLVLYNGNGGGAYNTVPLSGFLPDQDNGYGTKFFAISGIQNGSPDGIALATITDELIQFLSYEGTMTATNDVAAGVTSEEISEVETSSTPAGFSLQLVGTGTSYAEFTWSAPIASTYDEVNTGQSFGGDNNGGGDSTDNSGILPIVAVRSLAQGTEVSVTGIVTVADQLGGPAFIQDATGGIAVFDSQLHGDGNYTIGDSVVITATLSAFNNQLQLSNITAIQDLGPVTPVDPAQLLISQATASVEGQLITLVGVTFNASGIFFPETNYTVSDSLGNTYQVRIDGATDLVGYSIPTGTTNVTGALGSFRGNLQLLPRFIADVPGATPYEPGGSDIPQDSTFDLATWNMEFFGTTISNFGPSNVAQQIDNARTVLTGINANIVAVQEVSEESALASALEGTKYNFICSQVYSYSFEAPDPNFPAQKLCYLYDTTTVSVVSDRVVFDELYTAARNGEVATLNDHPGGSARSFWSSGRLPYMLVADVTIAGITEQITLVNIHAKSGSNSADKARREYDVRALKDTLDAYYGDANVVVLGDYNDDLDVSIAGGTSSYDYLVSDTANYNGVTLSLSLAGFKSFLFGNEMIDHQTYSNELADEFVAGSEALYIPFNDVSNFANTTSDHLPVITRYEFNLVPVEALVFSSICSDNPDSTRAWSISNPNDFDVAYSYQVYATGETGTGIAAPGENTFETVAAAGPNTTALRWDNERGMPQAVAIASEGAPCYVAPLRLDTDCSFVSSFERKFTVINDNPFSVDYTLTFNGRESNQVAAPGDNPLSLLANLSDDNILHIRWEDAEGLTQTTSISSEDLPCGADTVVSRYAEEVINFAQGLNNKGRAVHKGRSIPEKALGAPLENRFCNFVSLGFGGEIELRMDAPVLNKDGYDFIVVETTFGVKFISCYWYPEKARIYVSKFGVNWVDMGQTCRDGFFDLEGKTDWFQYIRIVDETDGIYFSRFADGFDVDGVISLNGYQSTAARQGLNAFHNDEPNEPLSAEMNFYPSPVKEQLTIELSLSTEEEVSISLYDLTGSLIYSETTMVSFQDERTIDMSALNSGAYILQVSTPSGSISQSERLIKE